MIKLLRRWYHHQIKQRHSRYLAWTFLWTAKNKKLVSLHDRISNTLVQTLEALSSLYQLVTGNFSFLGYRSKLHKKVFEHVLPTAAVKWQQLAGEVQLVYGFLMLKGIVNAPEKVEIWRTNSSRLDVLQVWSGQSYTMTLEKGKSWSSPFTRRFHSKKEKLSHRNLLTFFPVWEIRWRAKGANTLYEKWMTQLRA